MMTTVLRGSWRRRLATSSRQALSTLFRRSRFGGKPPAVQVEVVAGAAGPGTLTGQLAEPMPLRPSDTRTVMFEDEPADMPALLKVTAGPLPDTLPADALHSYVSGSPSGSDAVARTPVVSPGSRFERSTEQETVGLPFD